MSSDDGRDGDRGGRPLPAGDPAQGGAAARPVAHGDGRRYRRERAAGPFDETERLLRSGLRQDSDDEGLYAGAVLLVVHGGEPIEQIACGHAELFDRHGGRLSSPRPMGPDTVFDLASISKAVATANLAALLFEEGALKLNDPVAAYLPAFDRPDKRQITIAELLMHSSGLAAWLPFYLFVDDGEAALELIADLPVRHPPGRRREYSDVNFVLLGKLLEAVAGRPLDRLFAERIAGPLGLERTRYRPPPEWKPEVAATSLGNRMEERMCSERELPLTPPRAPSELAGWRRDVLVGEVNDANCQLVFGGVAGHAGLFGNAADLARLAAALQGSAAMGSGGLLRPDTLNYFTTPKVSPGQGLGWWTNRVGASPRSYGHQGFTGTQLFIDPHHDLVTVLLTNRVHGGLPYPEPSRYCHPIIASVYRSLGVAADSDVDPWLARA